MNSTYKIVMARKPTEKLRHGWTTGACATAAAKAAYTALLTGCFPDPVEIILPKGETPSFALAREKIDGKRASAAIVKDAGDDPDVTHGALIQVDIDPRDDDGHGVTHTKKRERERRRVEPPKTG